MTATGWVIWGVSLFLTLQLFAMANTVGFHRLLTHRSFKTKWWIRNLLGFLGAQYSGSPMMWVGVHRVHHTISEWRDDPHSPRYNGFWWERVRSACWYTRSFHSCTCWRRARAAVQNSTFVFTEFDNGNGTTSFCAGPDEENNYVVTE